MTDTLTAGTDTVQSDAAAQQLREAAHKAMRKAFGQLEAAYGSEVDALHGFVYQFDPTTRVRALNRIMSDGADLGQPSTVHVHLGGYEYQLVRDAVGKPETRIIAPQIDVYDRNGVKYATDGYGVKRKKGGTDDAVATSMDAAFDRVASNVGRMGRRIATAALVAHVPDSDDDRAEKKPRAASGTTAELASLREEMAADRALLQQVLAALAAK